MTDPVQEGDAVEERLDTLATEMLGALPPSLARQYAGRLNAAVAFAEDRSRLLAARVEELERERDEALNDLGRAHREIELDNEAIDAYRRERDWLEQRLERCQEALRAIEPVWE